jgi:hypothetical protein
MTENPVPWIALGIVLAIVNNAVWYLLFGFCPVLLGYFT